VAEQVEVVHSTEVAAVVGLEGDPAPAALARGARVEDEQIADHPAERAPGLTRKGRADEWAMLYRV
jgi:hypothetical protein